MIRPGMHPPFPPRGPDPFMHGPRPGMGPGPDHGPGFGPRPRFPMGPNGPHPGHMPGPPDGHMPGPPSKSASENFGSRKPPTYPSPNPIFFYLLSPRAKSLIRGGVGGVFPRNVE